MVQIIGQESSTLCQHQQILSIWGQIGANKILAFHPNFQVTVNERFSVYLPHIESVIFFRSNEIFILFQKGESDVTLIKRQINTERERCKVLKVSQ